jgi:hypothetical protein
MKDLIILYFAPFQDKANFNKNAPLEKYILFCH